MDIKRIMAFFLILVILSLAFICTQMYKIGYDVGYLQGVEDGAGRSWNIRDPTYNEAINFTKLDKTGESDYSNESYKCHIMSADFKNNAFLSGYRCAYVIIEFQDNRSHAIVCFNTTDRGIVFIEPQIDEIVTLKIGQKYKRLPSWGNVTRYVIMW
jgi:hypothetical protein